MSDWLLDQTDRRDGVTVPTIWLALALSLLIHAAVMWQWLPKIKLPSLEELKLRGPGSLTVSLAPPPAPPPEPQPSAALQTQPPLGLLHDFSTSGSGRDADTLDLKGQGARLFVDAARIYALQCRIAATGTAARLRAASAVLSVNRDEVAASLDAFFFIQLLRLRHDVLAAGADAPSANHIHPDRLNPLDRRILKEALRNARRVQKRLALDYQV